MLSPLSSLSRVMKIGLTSTTLSQVDMSTLARWTIRPRLMAIPGVANVAMWGQRDRQIQVLVDPRRLQAHGVTVDDVVEGHGRSGLAAGRRLPRHSQSEAGDHPRRRGAARERPRSHRRRVAETARCCGSATSPPSSKGSRNRSAMRSSTTDPGLLLIVEKQLGANTLQVTRDVESALEDLKPALAGVAIDPAIFRPATFIEMSLQNLSRALLIGCVLVILVLLVFLADWRTALISSTAIPLSLLAAGLLLHYRGGTLDTMVLAGLVIALGEVVDDAIIDVENIVRRLRLNRSSPNPLSPIRVVLDASMEVRSAVLYGSMIVVVVFVPVFMLDGLAGAFFRPLALVVRARHPRVAGRRVDGHTGAGAAALAKASRHAGVAPGGRAQGALPATAARLRRSPQDGARRLWPSMLALTAATVPFLGEEFLPHFREYDFLMHWVEKPGTSIDAMRRITERASRELMAVPGVRNFGAHIGRAEVADEVVGPNFTELWISLDPSVDYEATVAKIQSIVDGYPGLYRDLLTYLRERIKEVLTGASATVVVRVYGPELEQLRAQAQAVRGAIAKVEGVADLTVQAQVVVPKIEVRFDPDRAAAFGLTPGQVRSAAATLLQGSKVGEFYEDQRLFDVVVWGTPDVRRNLDAVRALQMPVANGGLVPLSSVAHVEVTPTPNEITRENGSRRIDVTSNVRGRDLGAVARDIQAQIAGLKFPAGYYAEVLGEYAERQASSTRLNLLGVAAVAAIFLILMADFGSARVATLVFLTLPFALVGAIVATFLTGGVLSLGSLVGLVTVIGISARNGIMLVSHYRHLEQSEGVPFGRDLIVRGSEERLAPILMTALATGLALVPIVLGGSRAGYEIEHPLAVVILGGLVTSTLLNLFIVPALYLKYGRPAVVRTEDQI